MNTADLLEMLRNKHRKADTIFLTEVADSTGCDISRYADAVAIHLWPSSGYEIEGYEIKLSVGDLQNELEDIRKWEGVGK